MLRRHYSGCLQTRRRFASESPVTGNPVSYEREFIGSNILSLSNLLFGENLQYLFPLKKYIFPFVQVNAASSRVGSPQSSPISLGYPLCVAVSVSFQYCRSLNT